MSIRQRQRIVRAFSAASDYDRHARVQRRVSEALADRIAALDLPAELKLLEIGCGTGFLTQAMAARGIGGEWLVTDLSSAMVERCRSRVAERPGRRFAVFDGEYGEAGRGERFDIICSSMTMQWFDDAPAAIGRMLGWLAPGGHLIFNMLTAGTFAEWRAAHMAEGLSAGTPTMPDAATLLALAPERQAAPPRIERIVEAHGDAREFLHAVRAIGAGTAAGDHRPLPPGALRRVMRRFDESGAQATYEVATCHFRGKG